MSAQDGETAAHPPWAEGSAWRELLDHIPTLVYVRDPAAGTIVFVNEALVRFTGRSESEILATGTRVFDEFVHPEDLAGVGDLSEALPLLGDGRDLRARNDRGEWRIISIRERELRTEALPRGHILGIATDVTERRRDEAALAASHAFSRRIADAGPTLVSVFDLRERRTTFANARWRAFHGLEADAIDRVDEAYYRDHLGPDDAPRFDEILAALCAMSENEVRESELQLRDHRGELRDLHTWDTVFGVGPDGAVQAVLSTALDVTEARARDREMAESEARLQQTQKLESLGLVAGGIAHDFNNLLTGILGYANLIGADADEDSDQALFAHEIGRAAGRAADLCSRLLTYSGRRPLAKEEVDLNEVLEEAAALLRASLPKSTRLEFALDEERLPIEADPLEVQQVAMNLLINASESLEGRPGVVRVRSGARVFTRSELREGLGSDDPPAGRYAFLEVRDEGVGMDADTLARVFEPFYSTKLSGRGLGLSVALRIVRHHGGVLRVESQPGVGTTIGALFPHRAATGRNPVTSAERRGLGELRATVLVVDDEESVRHVARQILERAGAVVIDVPDGEAGLAAFARLGDEVDVVLLDLTLPGLHGTEVARAMHEERADCPIVLMSGFSTEPALPYHVPFLRKPFDAASLLSTLNACLAGRLPAKPGEGVALPARLLRS